MMLIFLMTLTIFVSYLLSNKSLKMFGFIILILFTYFNLNRLFTNDINESGYIERSAIVAEIKKDAKENSYPCVSISFITDPGYQFGYRYFFFLEHLHVNPPSSLSPVYTIVYPLRDDIEVDKTFGALGLINPDYERYNMEEVEVACEGEDPNLTEPMWGMPI